MPGWNSLSLFPEPSDSRQHLLQRLPQNKSAFAKELNLFRPKFNRMPGQATAAPDDRGHAQGHVADVVAAVLNRRDRQHPPLIERDRMHHVANCDADSESGACLLLDDFRARALGASE